MAERRSVDGLRALDCVGTGASGHLRSLPWLTEEDLLRKHAVNLCVAFPAVILDNHELVVGVGDVTVGREDDAVAIPAREGRP
jgi:hypothetical protein